MAEEWYPKLIQWGVVREGHFLLTSGRHSSRFFLFAPAFSLPPVAEEIGRAIAARFEGQGIETVIGPAMGGIILAHEVARALGVRSVYAEKDGERMTLKRGFTLRAGEKVLVVEDAISTGGSVDKVLAICREAGTDIAGVGVVVDRSHGAVDVGVPMQALLTLGVPSWAPDDCPLCREGHLLERPKA